MFVNKLRIFVCFLALVVLAGGMSATQQPEPKKDALQPKSDVKKDDVKEQPKTDGKDVKKDKPSITVKSVFPPKSLEQQLGLQQLLPPGSALRSQLGLAKDLGLAVEKVKAGSAAAKAGLLPFDVIVQIQGKNVSSDLGALRKLLGELKSGTDVPVTVVRHGKQETIQGLRIPEFQVAEPKNAFPGISFKAPVFEKSVDLKLGLQALTAPGAALRDQLGLVKDQGLLVDSVKADSIAAKAGLRTYDIILQVQDKKVASDVTAFRKLLKEFKPGAAVDVVVMRHGKQETIQGLKLPEAPAADATIAPPK